MEGERVSIVRHVVLAADSDRFLLLPSPGRERLFSFRYRTNSEDGDEEASETEGDYSKVWSVSECNR